MIRVEDDGVEERLLFLSSCLAFKLVSSKAINWELFRSWACRNWGVPLDAEIRHDGDDVCLLVCSSEAEVHMILRLDRRKFANIWIYLDKWIKNARRFNISLEKDVG
ncbi:hypothetical protein LINGRAHAP2_LOCUS22335 [Linum grandiflorum]